MAWNDYVSLGVQILGVLSIIAVWIQLHQTEKIEKEHHEEQRRIRTVEVIRNWSANLKKETRLAEKIVENFDARQCKKLYNHIPFTVEDVEVYKDICQLCREKPNKQTVCKKCMTNGKFKVENEQLIELRAQVTNYLNNLEIVALAWQQAVVDTDEIVRQFLFLDTPGTKSALATYRAIAGGGKSYPLTEKFYQEIVKQNKPIVTLKEKQ